MARKFRETRQSWEFQPPHGIPLARNHNLYSYYPGFEGQARDLLNKNNGTITGTLKRATANVRGRTSLCWAFDGSTSIDLGSGSLFLQRPNFSIRLSVKVLSLANSYTALVSTVATQYLQLFVKSSGKLALYAKNAGTDSYDGTGAHTLAVGRWYDLEVTYDQVSGSGSVWVDKKLDGTFFLGAGNGFSSGMAALTIGRDTVTAGRVLTGHVQNLAFFTSTHTAAQVSEAVDDQWRLFVPRSVLAPLSAGGGSYSLTAGQGSYTLTGQAAGLLAGRILAASQGSYTLSGQDVALLKGNTLTAAQGAYSLTGQDVGLLRGLLLSAAQGSYALSGQDATLTYTPLGAYSLAADQGIYTLTGQSASLLWGPVLAAGQGSYALTGQDVTLTYTPVGAYILTAGQGSYALTGQDVLLQWGHVLVAAQGSYTLTGQAAALARGLVLAAAQGSYTLTGQAAAFARTYVLSAGYGSYALTGQIVSLSYSGAALEALEYLLLISHITQSMSKTSKVTMEVDLISRIQQQLDGSSSI